MIENGNFEDAQIKAEEIIELHLGENSEERITISSHMNLSNLLNNEWFNDLQRTWLRILDEKYEDFKQSTNYLAILETLNLEVKQYIVLRKAGLILNINYKITNN